MTGEEKAKPLGRRWFIYYGAIVGGCLAMLLANPFDDSGRTADGTAEQLYMSYFYRKLGHNIRIPVYGGIAGAFAAAVIRAATAAVRHPHGRIGLRSG